MDKVSQRRLRNRLSLIKHATYFEQDSSPRAACAKILASSPELRQLVQDSVGLWERDSNDTLDNIGT